MIESFSEKTGTWEGRKIAHRVYRYATKADDQKSRGEPVSFTHDFSNLHRRAQHQNCKLTIFLFAAAN